MVRICKHALSIGASALLLVAFSAQARVIDDFSVAQAKLDNETNGTTISSTVSGNALTQIIGGWRDLAVTCVLCGGGTGGEILVGTEIVAPFRDRLSFSTDAGATAVGIVQWDGNVVAVEGATYEVLNPTGLGGIDLTADGSNAFQFEVIFADLGFNFLIEVYSDASNFTQAVLSSAGVGVETIQFAALQSNILCGYDRSVDGDSYGVVGNVNDNVQSVTCGGTNAQGTGSAVNLTNLGAIGVSINVAPSQTLALDIGVTAVQTIPEPGLLGLIGIGLAAAGLARATTRRRKQTTA